MTRPRDDGFPPFLGRLTLHLAQFPFSFIVCNTFNLSPYIISQCYPSISFTIFPIIIIFNISPVSENHLFIIISYIISISESTLNVLFDSGVSPTIIAKAMTESVHSSTEKKGHSWLKLLLTLVVRRGKLWIK